MTSARTWASESQWLWEHRGLAVAFAAPGSEQAGWKARRQAQTDFIDSLYQAGCDGTLLVEGNGQRYKYSGRDGLEFIEEIED